MQRLLAIAALVLLLVPTPLALASEHKPVAVRWWGQSFVTIETHWGLTLAIDPYSLEIGYDDPEIAADLVCITHNHADHNNPDIVRGDPRVLRCLDEQHNPQRLHHSLDRYPNQDDVLVSDARLRIARSPHALYVRSIPAFHDNARGADRGHTGMLLVETDGLRILHCGDLGQHRLTPELIDAIGTIDVLLIPVGGVYTIDGPQAATIADALRARAVVPIHYKTDALTIDLDSADAFLDALPDRFEHRDVPGNTLAVTAGHGPTAEAPRVVLLNHEPWEMPADLADLFRAKEVAAAAAAEEYAALSANQLNHRPSNATHTPRWNAEHTAGTELLVMSAMLNAVDDSIPIIRETPAQMPPDYAPAHPEWEGPEQAREMQRIQDFSRRFAYLLDGLPLDELPDGAPRFFGSLRGYLEKMADHYAEHVANVRMKYDLPDWPDN